jgi:hypothetical protein
MSTPDYIHQIRSALDSLPFTAPECRTPVLRSLLEAVDGLLVESGWTRDGVVIDLPRGVTPEQAKAAVAALAHKEPTP